MKIKKSFSWNKAGLQIPTPSFIKMRIRPDAAATCKTTLIMRLNASEIIKIKMRWDLCSANRPTEVKIEFTIFSKFT
jgi:hypothetical protein